MLTKKFGKTTVYATTPEAVKKLEGGWHPCDKKKGCACGTVKPAAKPAPEKEPAKENEA